MTPPVVVEVRIHASSVKAEGAAAAVVLRLLGGDPGDRGERGVDEGEHEGHQHGEQRADDEAGGHPFAASRPRPAR